MGDGPRSRIDWSHRARGLMFAVLGAVGILVLMILIVLLVLSLGILHVYDR